MNLIEIMALALILAAALLSFYRLIVGPSNADRLVSVDALSLIATIILVLIAALFDSYLYLDIALMYAVLSFVGMVALAHVIDSKNVDSKGSTNAEFSTEVNASTKEKKVEK